jgi:hypothetical protein
MMSVFKNVGESIPMQVVPCLCGGILQVTFFCVFSFGGREGDPELRLASGGTPDSPHRFCCPFACASSLTAVQYHLPN